MTLAELTAIDWCDVVLESFAWTNDGRDIVLHIAGADDRRRTVTCRWAETLDVRIQSNSRNSAVPLSWDATFEQLPDGRFFVAFDFSSTGHIKLECAEIDVRFDA